MTERLASDSALAINCWLAANEAGTWRYKFDGAAMRIRLGLDVDGVTPIGLMEVFANGLRNAALGAPLYTLRLPPLVGP